MPSAKTESGSKIRVLHLITRLIKGGADENTILTIRGLKKEDYEVDLMIGGESDYNFIENLDDIKPILVNELRRNINPAKDFIAFYRIYNYIKKHDYTIIHTHTAKAGFLGRLAAKCAGTPVIIHTLHGITFHNFLNIIVKNIYIFLEKWVGKFTDKFITVGDDIKQKYIAKHIAEPDKYITIRSGFDLQQFIQTGTLSHTERSFERQRIGLKPTDIVIGSVSRLEPRKGHIHLIEAASKIVTQNQRIKFLIVGEGSYRTYLEDEVRRRNLTNWIMFLGYRSDIARIMALFDIFVLTSLWEGLPRVLVQAAALGKPIVTFDVEGAREVVVHEKNGFIIPAKNESKLIERLLWLSQHIDRAHQMGLMGKNLINESWDYRIMVQQINNLYQELLLRIKR